MKKTLTTAALALAGLLAVPTTADAGLEIRIGHDSRFSSSRHSCGCPASEVKRVFRGRDCSGRPIFSYVRVPARCNGGCRATVDRCGVSSRHDRNPDWRRGAARSFDDRHHDHRGADCDSGSCRF